MSEELPGLKLLQSSDQPIRDIDTEEETRLLESPLDGTNSKKSTESLHFSKQFVSNGHGIQHSFASRLYNDGELSVPLLTSLTTTDDEKPDFFEDSAAVIACEVETPEVDTDTHFLTYRPACPLAALNMNLSFAGCGFLGVYHLGVAKALSMHGAKLMFNTQKFAGASAGGLVAAALAVKGADPDVIERSTDFVYKLASDIRKKKLGTLSPGVSLLQPLEDFLTDLLPDEAYMIATDRLFISLTKRQGKKNMIVSQYKSNEHLTQCLMATSYIPFVTGSKTVYVATEKFIDGGMTDNLPILESGRTVCVSPFAGRQEICPVDHRGRQWFTRINKQDFQVNRKNLIRGLHALFPPKRKYLQRYHESGYKDAIRFLQAEGFYSADSRSVTLPESTAQTETSA